MKIERNLFFQTLPDFPERSGPSGNKREKQEKLDTMMDAIRDRFGRESITRGSALQKKKQNGDLKPDNDKR